MKSNPVWLPAVLLAVSCFAAAPGPGERGVLEDAGPSVPLLRCGFEDAGHGLDITDYNVDENIAHSGKHSLRGSVAGPRQARFLRIPFKGMANRRLELSFWARSTDKTRCAVWINEGGASAKSARNRRSVTALDNLPRKWVQIKGGAIPETDAPGFFEIVAPSSHGDQPPGSAWIDDVVLTAGASTRFTLDHAEDFPVLTTDGSGQVWLAVVARRVPEREIRILTIDKAGRHLSATLKPEGMTGIGVPDIAPLGKGCVVVVPVEQNDSWRIAYAFVRGDTEGVVPCRYVAADCNANISPAVAAHGDRAMVVWEANEHTRRIHAAEIGASGVSVVRRISDTALGATCCNPDIVALEDGSFFAAYDSLCGKQMDLYGKWFRNGKWSAEQRLTSHPRIERHVVLAARGNEVWLAWQAQSFRKHLVNNVDEQRIVVARLAGDKLLAPAGLFEKVSPPKSLLMRPEIVFDPAGRLWVTARRSIGAHEGWQSVAWSYGGDTWSGPHVLWSDQGRWRRVPMTFDRSGRGIVACQRDNLPRYWGVQVGKAADWASDVVLLPLPAVAPAGELVVTPLVMPPTEFALSNRIDQSSAFSLARETVNHDGRALSLFWGDMHEHTDMSVCQRARNPPIDDLYANQRDIERLDFTAITDHGYNIDQPQWQYSAERVRAFFDPGTFVSLFGEEWTSDQFQYDPKRPYRRYGHRNHIFRDTYFPRFFDSRDGNITPRAVWDDLKDVEFIAIPHQLADTGNCPTDWTFHDETCQPLAEIFQQRQSFEYLGCPRQAARATKFKGHFLQDAWALGIVIGVIASPDHGGGAGKAGVWCENLTRDDLFKAFHARHTFGTSGAKMGLFVSSGNHMMGDKVLRDGTSSIPFRVRAVADRPITRVVIMRNNVVVHEIVPGTKRVDMEWTDRDPPSEKQLWYYVRIHREDEELAWSSPMWFFKTQADLDATAEHARRLPTLYPHGVPSEYSQ